MENLSNLQEWAASPAVETVFFYVLAFLAIPLGFGVLFDRNVIRAGFLLIGVFGAIAGLFLLLQAQFLALAQVMIYAVGITLVVVIALMLTNPKMEKDASPSVAVHRTPAIITASLVFFTIYLAVRSESWPISDQPMPADNLYTIGVNLLTNFSLPFEFASVLLLAALIGAVMLAKAEPSRAPDAESEEADTSQTQSRERTNDVVKV